MTARMDAGVKLRLSQFDVRGKSYPETPRKLCPVAPGKAVSSAPLGPELSGGIFFALRAIEVRRSDGVTMRQA